MIYTAENFIANLLYIRAKLIMCVHMVDRIRGPIQSHFYPINIHVAPWALCIVNDQAKINGI